MKYTRIEILNNILDARKEKETFSFPLSKRIHVFKKKTNRHIFNYILKSLK